MSRYDILPLASVTEHKLVIFA